jgi:hypothetical protein
MDAFIDAMCLAYQLQSKQSKDKQPALFPTRLTVGASARIITWVLVAKQFTVWWEHAAWECVRKPQGPAPCNPRPAFKSLEQDFPARKLVHCVLRGLLWSI